MMDTKPGGSDMLPAYLAGKLNDEEKAEVERALAESAELREELAFWKKMRALARLDAAREAAGHLSPETILEFAEGSAKDRGAIELHLASCSECREDLELMRRLSPASNKEEKAIRRPLLDLLTEFFTVPRLGYALAIVLAVIIVVAAVDIFMGDRLPEWRQLQAEGDLNVEQGNDEAAGRLYRQALELTSRQPDSDAGFVSALFDSLATINRRAGNPSEARQLLELSLAMKQAGGLGETWGTAWVLEQIGTLEKIAGNVLESESFYRRADSIREVLAERHPDDENLQRYRRNIALVRLVPQTGFRGPETPPFPLVKFDDQTTHMEFQIVLRRNRDLSASYLPTLTTPSRLAFPLPDTLSVDPLHPSERTLRLTLSRRFFDEGKGTYRIGIRKLDALHEVVEDVYFFQISG